MVNHPRRSRRTVAAEPIHDHEAEYTAFRESVRISFDAAVAGGARLFCTTAEGLNDAYLAALPSDRQTHTCAACRRFIEAFGGLVTVADDGTPTPAMWSANVPDFYWPAVIAMGTLAQRARITAPFLSSDTTWGTPETRDRKGKSWYHLSVTMPAALRFKHSLLTPGQAMAAKREDFGTVARALAEFTPAMLDEALRLLEMETLYRSERFISPVKWLRMLHDRPKGKVGENLLWRAIAMAPDGYCHPRSSVVGTLLEDIAAGLPFATIKANFDAKMHPLHYQRPQALPSAGNIAQAEKIVEQMGIARSLERRFARLEEIESFWQPVQINEPAANGVFGHLKAKGSTPVGVDIPSVTMTWEKFSRMALPMAEAMELRVPPHGNFIAILTSAHADAPPILKWDNTFSVYVYHSGSPAAQWRLTPGWTRINALSYRPNQWGERGADFLGEGVIAILDGAMDTKTGQGNAIFPETLRGELHAVRSTIEAYSRRAEIGGKEDGSACGYNWGKGNIGVSIRVLSHGRWTAYTIDRWD